MVYGGCYLGLPLLFAGYVVQVDGRRHGFAAGAVVRTALCKLKVAYKQQRQRTQT